MARKKTARTCRCDDLEARLERVEELAQSNRRELDIQFRRIADLQALVDSHLVDRRRHKGDGKPDGKANGKAGPDGKVDGKPDGRAHAWRGGDSWREV